MKSKSIGIIGAGIGGLMAGAYLAKAGYRVTVLEKAATVGGSAGWYTRRGYRFPTGATIAFGLEQNGLLRFHLEELGIEGLDAALLDHPMDIMLPDRTLSIYKDSDIWEKELRSKFPERAERILRFWRHLDRLAQGVYAVTKSGVSLPVRRLHDVGSLPSFVRKNPFTALKLAYYAQWTVERLMKLYRIESYEPFRKMLNLQLVDAVQTDVSQAALLPSALALTIYRQGSFCLPRGLGEISEALANRIEQLGGRVITSSPVMAAAYEGQWKVESKRCSDSFDLLINNAGSSLLLALGLLPESEVKLKHQTNVWGAFRLDAIVEEAAATALLPHAKLPFAYQIAPSSDHAELFGDKHGPVYVTFQHTIDRRGQIVPGKITMTASVHTKPSLWQKRDEAYAANKDRTTAAILAEIDRVIPISQHVLNMDAGTPSTYEWYIGKSEVGGAASTIDHAIRNPMSYRTSLPSLYQTGEGVFPGPGTLSAALSGYYAARAIIKEHRT